MLRAGKPDKQYKDATLVECKETIKSGKYSVRKASSVYEIPCSTLMDKLSGRTPVHTTQGPSPVLTKAEEKNLVEWIFYMGKIGYGQRESSV
ncbi:hypothetical protein HOLleu_00279 [Holothuria leucospilota]|uniref:HTH psq-type domain-containing protein n=1 Tax=Holothuria leucospilota TaxID=206669 RepID=A0A9Q1HK55_HOLLE|nr:hypothetical protein HOLleu_00279 [Holothuria leucospilota]